MGTCVSPQTYAFETHVLCLYLLHILELSYLKKSIEGAFELRIAASAVPTNWWAFVSIRLTLNPDSIACSSSFVSHRLC